MWITRLNWLDWNWEANEWKINTWFFFIQNVWKSVLVITVCVLELFVWQDDCCHLSVNKTITFGFRIVKLSFTKQKQFTLFPLKFSQSLFSNILSKFLNIICIEIDKIDKWLSSAFYILAPNAIIYSKMRRYWTSFIVVQRYHVMEQLFQ